MVDEILIHFDPVHIFAKVYPVCISPDFRSVFLLQEQDIGRNLIRARIVLEGIIRETYCADQFCTVCKILPDRRILLIHRAF